MERHSLTRRIALTRLQGGLADVLTGLGVGVALNHWLGGALLGLSAALRWTSVRAVRALERATPATRHALQAWHQGGGGELRSRLEAWLEQRVVVPVLWRSVLQVAVALLLVVGARGLVGAEHPRTQPSAPVPLAQLEVSVQVEPPAYAHQPVTQLPGPRVDALRGSSVLISFRASASELTVDEPGEVPVRLVVNGGRADLRFVLWQTRTLRVTSADFTGPLLLTVHATPDAPPSVELQVPVDDRVVTSAPAPFELRAAASDDYGLVSLTLHYSLAQGSGEAMRFKSGRLPATVLRDGAEALALVRPQTLGMAAGDTLALWAEARDGRTLEGEGPQVSRSGVRLLKWEVPVTEMTGGSSAMPPPPKSLLSQRELLARTERLLKSGVRGEAFERASAELATDQRALRTSFSQVLNSEAGTSLELDVDEKEAAQSTDVRAHALLAKAVSAMWASETALSTNQPRQSVPPQREAVAALDAAFSLVRMSLRPLAQPDKPVDEARRLTGARKGLIANGVPWAPPSPRTPALNERIIALTLSLSAGAAAGLDAAAARQLGDALWALPPAAQVPSAELATALYAAATPSSASAAARQVAQALSRSLHLASLVRSPSDRAGTAVVNRLPLVPR